MGLLDQNLARASAGNIFFYYFKYVGAYRTRLGPGDQVDCGIGAHIVSPVGFRRLFAEEERLLRYLSMGYIR